MSYHTIRCTTAALLILLNFTIPIKSQETYTQMEKALLGELRYLVKSSLQADYMKSDCYLIRWLRAQNFNVNDAKEMFEKALEWRKINKIDGILTEDLCEIFRKAPYNLDGIDNYGRPVLTFNPGRWNIRRFILGGKSRDLRRFLDQMTERLQVRINKIGQNITQGIIILDISGYSLRQHGCLQCAAPLIGWITNYENYYPGLLAGFHLINTPKIFFGLFEIIKSLFSVETRNVLKVHGSDKNEWSREILKTIPANQLSSQYGGRKRNKLLQS